MNNNAVYDKLKHFPDSRILKDEPMKTTLLLRLAAWRIFCSAEKCRAISRLVRAFRRADFCYGQRTNLLVSDKGIRGIVVKIYSGMNKISVNGSYLTCQSARFVKNSRGCFEAFSGRLDFSRIPGTLGGAVVMNAGAFDGEMKDVVVSTRYIDETGELKETTEHGFGYRTSMFSAGRYNNRKHRALPKNKDEIKSKMSLLAGKGVKTALDMPSAVYLKAARLLRGKAYPGRRA